MSHSVKVRILDKVYDVACSPGKESYVEDLGRRLNEKVHVISGVVGGQTTEQHLVVTALFLMEEMLSAKSTKGQNDNGNSNPAEVGALNDVIQNIESICDRLESVQAGATQN